MKKYEQSHNPKSSNEKSSEQIIDPEISEQEQEMEEFDEDTFGLFGDLGSEEEEDSVPQFQRPQSFVKKFNQSKIKGKVSKQRRIKKRK